MSGRDTYFMEMVKKGTSTYIKMYPNYAQDLFQAGCEGMAVALERDYRGGQAMKCIRGRVKNWLAKYADHPRPYFDVIEGAVVDETIISKRIEEIIVDLTDDERERRLLACIANGDSVEEAGKRCGMSRSIAFDAVASIRKTRRLDEFVSRSVHGIGYSNASDLIYQGA